MVKKFEIPKLENAALAKSAFGAGVGSTVPLVLKLYADPQFPDGVPFVNTIIPSPWNKVSVFGSLALGAGSLLAGVLIKSLRYALIPLGVGSVCVGAMLGITTPPALAKTPLVRLKAAAPGAAVHAGARTQLKLTPAGVRDHLPAGYNSRNEILASSRKATSQPKTNRWDEIAKQEIQRAAFPLRG